ncbi:hypothetical protein Tco_0541310 [Tanacetum coccineum]
MNLIKHDAVLGRLKFVGKYKENKVYGMSIPDVMVNQEIKDSKAYQTYLAFSIGAVISKKARKGTKANATPKKISSITADEDIIPDLEEARRRPTGVVTLPMHRYAVSSLMDTAYRGLDEEEIILTSDDERTKSKREVAGSEEFDEEKANEEYVHIDDEHYDDEMHEDEELHTEDEARDDEYVHNEDEKHDANERIDDEKIN